MESLLLLAPLPEFLLSPLKAVYACHDGTARLDDVVAEHGAEVRGIVMAGGSAAPAPLLERLPALEILAVFGVGYDGVPVDYCRARGSSP
ncbi:MAG TPA: hydroxyacid dehydrogenase, partial [Verrucomicrobiales bacterium]|nr:hydroxyacid dehydrogenase [Verrucomicrobiales bacterium]